MASLKTYVPKSKAKVQKTTFGDILKLGFHAETLAAFCKQHQNEAGYINLDIVPRRETDAYGNTHSVVLNDWKPDASRRQEPRPTVEPNTKPLTQPESDDVPF
jgi:hypothetical protein